MTQEASFKRALKSGFSIFKWELKNCSGFMTVFSIIAAVFTTITFTLCLVFGLSDIYSSSPADAETLKGCIVAFQLVSSYAVFYLNAVFTIIYTIIIYSYLHNKRKADLYGSLPVSRETFYLSKTLSAFIFSVVPTMFFWGLIAIVSVCFGQPLISEVSSLYIKLPLGALACISFYGLLSVCCGTTLNSVLSFIAIVFTYPISALFVKGIIRSFFYGLPANIYSNHFIMKALNPLAAYDGVNIIYWLLFTIACLLLGRFLVKRRRAECAQTSFAYYLPAHMVKLLVSFIAGMFLGVLFGTLNVFGEGFAGFVFGFILGSVPAFVIVHMIFYKGFSRLIKSSVFLGGLIVVTLTAVGLCCFDLFGFNSYIPDKSEIASAGLIDMSDCYKNGKSYARLARESAEDFSDKDSIDAITGFHKSILNSREDTSAFKFACVWSDMIVSNLPSELFDNGYCVAYKLKSGRIVTRMYDSAINDIFDSSYFPNEFYAESITSKPVYIKKYNAVFNITPDELNSVEVSHDSDDYYNTATTDKEAAHKILEAYRSDLDNRNEDSPYSNYVVELRFSYEVNESANFSGGLMELLTSDYGSKESSFNVYAEDENTLRVLRELEIIEKDSYSINKDGKFYDDYDYYNYSYYSD